nr:M28 family peptidase [Jiangella aurantiaca]
MGRGIRGSCRTGRSTAGVGRETGREHRAARCRDHGRHHGAHLEVLQDIADANGGTRASGTPGYDESLEYVKAQLDAAGYQTTVFAGQGLETEPTAFDGRSDYDAFISVGIPAGGLFSGAEGIKTAEQAAIYGGTAGVAYDPCYHAECDDITNLSIEALDEFSDAAAHATLAFAMTTSAIEGTDKGNATGQSESLFLGSHLRR